MSATPTLFASRPLIQFTTPSSTRVAASASTTSSSAASSDGASGCRFALVRISSTRYCCSFGGASSIATPTSIKPHIPRAVGHCGSQKLPEPGDDRLARQAARARFSLRGQAQAALRAVGRIAPARRDARSTSLPVRRSSSLSASLWNRVASVFE